MVDLSFCGEKIDRTTACQQLIDDFLMPASCLPFSPCSSTIRSIFDILGKWTGNRHRSVQRYRSGFPENLGEEFDAPLALLNWISSNRFDSQWHRHTGEWFCLDRGLTLAESIDTKIR